MTSQSSATERFVQSTTDARTMVHLSVNKDAVQKLLPAGWVSEPGAGPVEGANVFIVFIEGIAGQDADGKPVLNIGKTVVLGVPVKNEKTGALAAMAVGGFVSDAKAVPGAYDVYVHAEIAMEKTIRSEGAGTVVEERWSVTTPAGDKLQFSASYARGVGQRMHVEPRIHAAVRPDFYRVYKADQVVEIVHSSAGEGKRARNLVLRASGPQLGGIFDGQERVVAVMAIPAYARDIFVSE